MEINSKSKGVCTVLDGVHEHVNNKAMNKFYEEVQEELVDRENLLVMGDLNGRVGNQNEGFEKVVGSEGEEKENNNRGRVTDICIEKDL